MDSDAAIPGLPLMPLKGMPVLYHLIERLKFCECTKQISVLTSTDPSDDAIESLCKANGVTSVRTSEKTLVSQLLDGSVQTGADVCVVVEPKNVMADAWVVDEMVLTFQEGKGGLDAVSNTFKRSFPKGLDVEIYSKKGLEKLLGHTDDPNALNAPVDYLQKNKAQFRVENYLAEENESDYEWALETLDDYEMLSKCFDALYEPGEPFTTEELMRFLEKHPEIKKINQG